MAEGGIAASMGNVWPEDNWQVHFRDTMRGGKMLNNWRMAQLHAQEAPERVLELEEWGALFDRTAEGLISQRDFGGHRYARLAHVGDRTGLEMIRTLQQRAVALGIDVFMECTVTEIFRDSGRVSGAFAYWRETGRFIVFKAPSVVLATGGIGKSYQVTSNSWEYTGDGHALALRTGASLINMEFVQFHPTGMVWPPSVKGLLVTESVRGDGGVLRNSEGRRFMFDHIPEYFKAETADTEEEGDRWYEDKKNNRRPPELLPRDEVARAINSEIKAGRGTPHGGSTLTSPRDGHRSSSVVGCPRCTTSSRSSPTSTSRPSRWRSDHVPLRDGGAARASSRPVPATAASAPAVRTNERRESASDGMVTSLARGDPPKPSAPRARAPEIRAVRIRVSIGVGRCAAGKRVSMSFKTRSTKAPTPSRKAPTT